MRPKNSMVYLLARSNESPPASPMPDERTATRVFAKIERIGTKEFYESAAVGMEPVLKITIWSAEYAGQIFVRTGGTTYKVLRAYDESSSGETELTCEEAIL